MLHDMSNFDGRVLSVILSDSNKTLHELTHLYIVEIYNITLNKLNNIIVKIVIPENSSTYNIENMQFYEVPEMS